MAINVSMQAEEPAPSTPETPTKTLSIDGDSFAKMYLGQSSLAFTFWMWGCVYPLAFVVFVMILTVATFGEHVLDAEEFWVMLNWPLGLWNIVWIIGLWRCTAEITGWGVTARIVGIISLVVIAIELLAGQTMG